MAAELSAAAVLRSLGDYKVKLDCGFRRNDD
jgi:hypothetical protein